MTARIRSLLFGSLGPCLLAAASVPAIAPAVFAQPAGGVPGPGPGMPLITDFKTPPLADTDTFAITLEMHFKGPIPPKVGWAGAIMKLHILDATEVDIAGFFPDPAFTGLAVGPFGTSPFGPSSNNLESAPLFFTFWYDGPGGTTPLQSGFVSPDSAWKNLGIMLLHAKNTTPLNNSDIDVTAMFWNIWHIRAGPTGNSQFVQLGPSDFLRQGTPASPYGTWIHVTGHQTFHLTSALASNFYATFANTLFIGVEHVPEPSSAVLLGGGFLALGCYARRRRLA
jgi:hypothetical protein